MDDKALARGFAVATSGLNTPRPELQHGRLRRGADDAQGAHRRHYGDIRYTIGEGCSGGAIQQQKIASTYPGLLDGLQPACSFPDIWTTALEVGDCHLLQHYFDTKSPQLWASPEQRRAVYGYQTGTACPAWINVLRLRQVQRPGEQRQHVHDVRAARRAGLRPRDQPRRRALHDLRLPGGDLRPARAGRLRQPAVRQRRRAVRAGGAGVRRDHAPSSSSTSTRRSAAPTSTASSPPSARRPTRARWRSPTARARSPTAASSRACRSSTSAARRTTRSTPTSTPTRCARGCGATTARRPTR